MNCIEAQKRMNMYLENRLSGEELTGFLDHVQYCDECTEELDLYLIIHQVLDESETDEKGEVYIYRKTLQQRMIESRKEIRNRRIKKMATFFLVAFMLLLVLLVQYEEVFRQMHRDRHGSGNAAQESELLETETEEVYETTETGSN